MDGVEIEAVVKGPNGTKRSGLDVFNFAFFKRFRSLLRLGELKAEEIF